MELFNDQNFEKIQKKHSELGVPWSDPTFSASDASIGLSKVKDLPRNIEWKRPYVSSLRNLYFLHSGNTLILKCIIYIKLNISYTFSFKEITTKPKLFVDGMSAGDVTQGNKSYQYVSHF